MRSHALSLAAALLASFFADAASAQGLIWQLPEDGTWVRYEGKYRQIVQRPNSTEGPLRLEWTRYLWIKSVGSETANHDGENTPCRWLELKVVTGNAAAGIIEPGPGGQRIYKILVPESAIRGSTHAPIGDGRELFVAYLPIVKGYHKIGDGPVQPIEEDVFQIYPVLSLLRHYRNLESTGETESVDTPAGAFDATRYTGSITTETLTSRTTTSCEMLRSDSAPFGIVKWVGRAALEKKNSTEPRSAFRETNESVEEMTLQEVGDQAEAEILED
ncbi:hypothetical protein Mal4_47780 [Maioricimonas rarisocia]|uniref:Uncharacterized protein n=1 Tax=Maioricimonas rarisocia TaxID=2528026 RepID=A0A517ZD79_9PLAN|nr:hypothetical protein [Maioricimonas rarisocia]QDU40422.1 hypothetical protein Mal4_47780 [Maioricimonas rarisocia]